MIDGVKLLARMRDRKNKATSRATAENSRGANPRGTKGHRITGEDRRAFSQEEQEIVDMALRGEWYDTADEAAAIKGAVGSEFKRRGRKVREVLAARGYRIEHEQSGRYHRWRISPPS
jgi:hypothetical protein